MGRSKISKICTNFLTKTVKLLPILYDFAVASLADAWIKINKFAIRLPSSIVASLADAWNCYTLPKILSKCSRIFPYKKVHYTIIVYRIPRECVD